MKYNQAILLKKLENCRKQLQKMDLLSLYRLANILDEEIKKKELKGDLNRVRYSN